MTLDSPTFLALCLLGIVVLRLAGSSSVRDVLLLGVNAIFLAAAMSSVHATILLAGLLAVVYVLGEIVARVPQARAAALASASIIGLWGTLFLLKDPTLLSPINPFAGFPVAVIGISYMTFRCISYLMEVGTLRPQGPLRYLNYVVFFPTLVAGPIDRWRNFNATFIAPADTDVLPELHRIANGFIKKFVLADNLSAFSVPAISALQRSGEASAPLLWLGGVLQLFLIYLDFSGYCDIVIGVSRLMGIRVIENFNRPFISRNIQEFWERWHISLSSLLRDYVFTPITKQILVRGSKRIQFPLVVFSYFFVMILIALWHGTSQGFMLFGVVHGGALVVYQLWRRRTSRRKTRRSVLGVDPWKWAAICFTYLFVSISLVFWMSVDNGWAAYFLGMLGIES